MWIHVGLLTRTPRETYKKTRESSVLNCWNHGEIIIFLGFWDIFQKRPSCFFPISAPNSESSSSSSKFGSIWTRTSQKRPGTWRSSICITTNLLSSMLWHKRFGACGPGTKGISYTQSKNLHGILLNSPSCQPCVLDTHCMLFSQMSGPCMS